MTEILTHDQIVEYAYFLGVGLLDINWSPNGKLKLLEAARPYFEQIARAESEAYRLFPPPPPPPPPRVF